MNFSKNILLTGAGYTANYGGFLANDMYGKIFNNPKIKSLLDPAQAIIRNSDDFDYEGIYSDIDDSISVRQEDKLLTRELVIDAYKDLDKDLKSHPNKADGMRGKIGRTLIQKFIGRGEEKGFWFTLNQDLLEESRSGKRAFGIPLNLAEKLTKKQELNKEDFIPLPSLKEVEMLKDSAGAYGGLNDLNYIKLHGSYGWLSASDKDGMVFGKNKLRDIEKEPLLNFYLSLFKEVLCGRENVTLLVIGYSFRDTPINDVILDAVVNHGLRLIIVGSNMKTLKNQLYYGSDILETTAGQELPTKEIWDKRFGYFDKKLIEIFEDTNDANLNTFAEDLLKQLS